MLLAKVIFIVLRKIYHRAKKIDSLVNEKIFKYFPPPNLTERGVKVSWLTALEISTSRSD